MLLRHAAFAAMLTLYAERLLLNIEHCCCYYQAC